MNWCLIYTDLNVLKTYKAMARQSYQRLLRSMARKLKDSKTRQGPVSYEAFEALLEFIAGKADEIRALDTKISGLETKIDARISSEIGIPRGKTDTPRSEVKAEIGALRGEIGTLRSDMQKGFDKIDKNEKYNQLLLLGAMGIALGLYGLKDKDVTLPPVPFFNNSSTKTDLSKAPSPPDLER